MYTRTNYVAKKVLVLYTGGTIGMQRNSQGVYEPLNGKFIEEIKRIGAFHDPKLAEELRLTAEELVIPDIQMNNNLIYTIKEYEPLLDSSNMSVEDWQKIADDIEEEYDNFDGFVILHGTDTITYTASALSFILEGLNRPVILTGSQIPIFEVRNDAKENFLTSLVLCSCFDIREVCIYFSNKLFRGNRTRKISSDLLEAFKSPNYHILADCGIDIKVYQQYLFKPDEQPLKLNVKKSLNPNVGMFYLFPTITVNMLTSFLKPPIEGIVLVSYGAGNIQSAREDILEILKEAVDRGIIIVNVTQCVQGTVNSSYATGQVLNSIGVLPGFDMTAEAALCKLSFVLGLEDKSFKQKKEMMLKDLRGELTITAEM